MPQNRYFLQKRFEEGLELQLKDEEFHYLRKVMRQRVGDAVECINGKGELATAHITHLSDKQATLSLTAVEKASPLAFSITLALALLKPAHLEYALEKATEVGVDRFLLYSAARSEKKLVSLTYLTRLQSIILSATKQCGRLFLPTIEIRDSLRNCIEGTTLFGDLESRKRVGEVALEEQVTFVVGPESGFTEQERALLIQEKAIGVSLHPYTLRAETAAVIGPALLFEQLNSTHSE